MKSDHLHLHWLPTETDHKSEGSDFYVWNSKVKWYLNTPVFIYIDFWLKVIPKVKGLTFTLNSKVKWYLKRPILICIELRQKLITKVRGLTFTFEKVRQSDTERRPFSFALDSDWNWSQKWGFWKIVPFESKMAWSHLGTTSKHIHGST